MPTIRARISLNHGGQEIGSASAAPLRFAYVRHEPLGPTYVTDINGVIRNQDGDEGIDSATRHADITIHCQNSIARVLNGADLFQGCPTVSATIELQPNNARDQVTIISTNPHLQHFRILNQIFATYHLVWSQFEPFRSCAHFPLGRSRDLETTRNQKARVEVLFPSPASALVNLAIEMGVDLPENMRRVFSFTDPTGTIDGWPRINLEADPPENRLFRGGGAFPNGNRRDLTVIPAELAHALHFSLLTPATRTRIRNDYLKFIFEQLANGLLATHQIGVITTPMVAFIESLDHFSHRLSERVRSRLRTFPASPPSAGRYPLDELRGRVPQGPRVAQFAVDRSERPSQVEARPADGLNLFGSVDEGAVFGALFIDLAFRIGLQETVEAILESKTLSFGAFRRWFNRNRSDQAAELDEAAQTWGL
jgi:hypothetical protein